jgi:NADH:ubiquinone oxidoreductase subunit
MEASSSTENSEDTTTIEIPRYKPNNPFNYSEFDKSKRAKAIRDAEKDYPTVPPMWIEWLYDVIENKDPEEVKRIIENNEWDKEPEQKHTLGGTLKSMVIESPHESESENDTDTGEKERYLGIKGLDPEA